MTPPELPPAADWYRRRRVRKARGWREISEPAPWLLEIQRKILRDVLDKLDPGPYAHGFVRGRSTFTYAAPHCGRNVVVRFDLADFFGSVPHSIAWRAIEAVTGPSAAACELAAYCVDPLNTSGQGLPQGAPTSPALANLAAHELDGHLAALARDEGMIFTRYADDFTFSGDFCDALPFIDSVRAEVQMGGFRLNEKKTRAMWATERQTLAGLVVNGPEPRPPREVRDRARAAAHRGTKGDAQAQGLVSYVKQMGGVRR